MDSLPLSGHFREIFPEKWGPCRSGEFPLLFFWISHAYPDCRRWEEIVNRLIDMAGSNSSLKFILSGQWRGPAFLNEVWDLSREKAKEDLDNITRQTYRQAWGPNFTVLFEPAWRGLSQRGLEASFRSQVSSCRSKRKTCNPSSLAFLKFRRISNQGQRLTGEGFSANSFPREEALLSFLRIFGLLFRG